MSKLNFKRGEMGVGTLIVLIAVLLVAAVAAGVLLLTTGTLQQKSLSTGSEAKGEIATQMKVVSIDGEDGQNNYLDTVKITSKLQISSDPIGLDSMILSESTTSSASTLTYKPNAQCINDPFAGFFTARLEDQAARYTAFNDQIPGTFSFSSSQTSEMMIGKIAVAIIFVESNGSVDPNIENWTTAEQDYLIDDTTTALNWWSDIEPRAGIKHTFEVYRDVPISYEPITRDTAVSNQTLWMTEALDYIGADSGASVLARTRTFANQLRQRMNAHWGFVFFIADSSDSGGGFTDGYAGIAYINGPHVFIAGDAYGADAPALIAHEFGHIFGARDQYTSSNCACTNTGGYFGIETQNCDPAAGICLMNESSIMRGGIDTITAYHNDEVDYFALAQIGLIDTNENNLLDPIDLLFEDSTGVDVTQANINTLAFTSQTYSAARSTMVGWYSGTYLHEGNNYHQGTLQRGDLLKVCTELSRQLYEDEEVRLNLMPRLGSPITANFITPQVISEKTIHLYP